MSKDKTYVWVRQGSLASSHNEHGARAQGNVANKRRGAPPTSSSSSSDVNNWGWTPGYYCIVEPDEATTSAAPSASEEKEGGGSGTTTQIYHFTLLVNFNGDQRGDDDNGGEDFRKEPEQYTITAASVSKLLESGDIVLANAWEEKDFANRESVNDDDDESYNYDDDDDSESDDDGGEGAKTSLDHLLGNTSPEDAPPSNLIELTHLHEPSVVHALRHRYDKTNVDMATNIYTDTGPILLAVNPFRNDQSGLLYGEGTVKRYRLEGEGRWSKERGNFGGGSKSDAKHSEETAKTKGEAVVDDEIISQPLPPHVYAVADRTFRTMMTRMHPPMDVSPSNASSSAKSPLPQKDKNAIVPKVNQSVLVSGESGAGKTVTTKL